MFSGTDEDDLFNPAASSHLAALFGAQMKPSQINNESLVYTPPKQPKTNVSNTAIDAPKQKPTSSAVLCAKVIGLYKNVDGQYSFQGKYGLALIGNDSIKAYELIVYRDKQNILTRAKVQPTFTYTLCRDNFATFFDDQGQNWSVLFDNAKDYTDFHTELEKRSVKIVENVQKTEDDQTTKLEEADTVSKTADENQSDSNSIKANILSRMAKMGQAILPVSAQSGASDYADSDSDVSNVSRKSRKLKRTEKPPIASSKPDISKPKQLLLSSASQYVPSVVPVQNTLPQMVLSHHSLVSPTVDPLNLLLAENRTHNCEIRMNLTQLSSKIDDVLRKIDQTEKESAEERLLKAKVQSLELKVANLTRDLEGTIDTNIELQRKLLDISKKADVVSCGDSNQQEKLAVLEKELKERETTIKLLREENETLKKHQEEISQLLKSDEFNIEEFTKIYEENKDNETFLKILYESLYKELRDLKEKRLNESVEVNNAKVENFVDKLNTVMQDFQQYILKHFDSDNSTFPPDFTNKLLPKSVKTATGYLIKEFERDFKISEVSSEIFKPEL